MSLFEPITIRGMKLENRIVYPAIQINMGLTNRRARAFYAERALGGAGLVITANTSVDNLASDELWGGVDELNGFIGRLKKLTDQVHQSGAKIGLQLWMANRFPQGRGVQIAGVEADPSSGDSVAPSAREDMRELTIPEIEAIIYRFAVGSLNVKKAGFDCVEIHAAHQYLACQFSALETNQRTDKYGGDPERRTRFGLDMVRAVRAYVGPDYPILFRLGALEKEGVIHPDSLAYAGKLEEAGVDCLDVSTGGFGSTPVTPLKNEKMGLLIFLAEAIKNEVGIPVIGVGRINTPEIAQEILDGGRADMVAIGRQLIADPFWPRKVEEGRFSDVTACKSCNVNCYSAAFERKLPEGSPLCAVNEKVGKEWES